MVIDSKVCKKTSLKAFVWKEGKKLGEVELNFEIKHLMYFEQKNAGVLTENGVMTMSPLIRFDEEFENNQNINLIIKKFKKLKNENKKKWILLMLRILFVVWWKMRI